MKSWLTKKASCPVDQLQIGEADIFDDLKTERQLMAKTVMCPNVDSQNTKCNWKGSLSDVPQHLENCPYESVPCPRRCGHKIHRKEMKSHADNDCVKRWVECQFCKIMFRYKYMAKHLELCPMFPMPCPNFCGDTSTRGDLKTHRSNCPLEKILCPLIVCSKPLIRKELQEHLTNSVVEHQLKLDTQNSVLVHKIQQLETQIQQLETQVTPHSKKRKHGGNDCTSRKKKAVKKRKKKITSSESSSESNT